MAGELTFRFAGPEDAKPLSEWALANNLIDSGDIVAATKEENPTSVVLVVEQDGKVLLYAPIYCAMTLAFLAFNPELDLKPELSRQEMVEIGHKKKDALAHMQKAIAAFGLLHGVTELITYSKEQYGVAKWAMKNGFKPESRTAFKCKMGTETEVLNVL